MRGAGGETLPSPSCHCGGTAPSLPLPCPNPRVLAVLTIFTAPIDCYHTQVGPSLRDPNGVRLIASAYRAVSHVGEFNIDALKATGAIPHNALRRYWPKPTGSAETQWKADLKSCTYFYLKYSPT